MNFKMNKAKMTVILLFLVFTLLLSSCSFVIVHEGSYRDPGRVDTGDSETVTTAAETAADEPDDGDGDKVTKLSTAEKAKKRLSELAEYDCGGANFIIATASNMTFATDGEDYYDRALLLRDSMIEERYGVDIVTIYVDEGKMASEMRNARLSGDIFADAVSVSEYRVGGLAAEGLIRNLRSLPFWSASASRSSYALEAAAGNAIYADLGAASSDFDKVYAVFYNREIEAKLGIDLVSIVRDGEWTWDEYEKYAMLATSTLGVSGQGSVRGGDEYTDVLFCSEGLSLIDNTLGKTPRISFNSEALEYAVERVCELVYGNPSYYKGGNFFTDLGEGNLFMGVAPLGNMADVAAECRDFGILPIPKMTIDQEDHFAYTEASAAVLCVTAENNKYEMTGHIINALNTASYEYLAEEYKNHCFYNYFSSEAPLAVFDIITGSMTFDFSYIYSSAVNGLREATFGAVREARTSVSDTATKLISLRMDAVNDRLEELYGSKQPITDVVYKPTTDTTVPEDVTTTDPETDKLPETETDIGTDTDLSTDETTEIGTVLETEPETANETNTETDTDINTETE